MSRYATVAALGVWAVIADMTVLVAAKSFDIRAILPCVTCLHQATVSTSFGLQPNNHSDDRRRGILGVGEETGALKIGTK